jgi:HEAT repeat protein
MTSEIHLFSYLLGLVSGLLLAFIYSKMVPLFKEMRANWRQQREESAARRATSVEDNFRRVTLRRAQGMHLAAPLFALDEILFPPLLIAPPPRVEPGGPLPPDDAVNQTLPYIPDWPELATVYRAPTLTLPQALSGGSNLVITGADGAGKTVALAYLASLAANKDARLGEYSAIVPFLFHAADLNLPVGDPKNILNPIIDVASEFMPLLDVGRIPGFVQFSFRAGTALLLLDGFDELAPEAQTTVTDFLKTLIAAYPKCRVVTTAIPEQLGGLAGLGFASLPLMGWSGQTQKQFVHKWGELWTRFVGNEAWAQANLQAVDPQLIEVWLNVGAQFLTPLELTLKVWAAFAGDCLGPHTLEAIAAHIRRIAPSGTPPAALETLAMQAVVNAQMVFDPRKARDWVKSFEVVEEKPVEGAPGLAEGEAASKTGPLGKKEKAATVQTASSGLLNKMVSSGLLISHASNHMRFAHPVFGGYLAGRAMTAFNAEDTLLNQPAWSGKLLALRYYAAHGNPNRIVDYLLAQEDRVLQRLLMTAAHWMKDAPRDAVWRGKVMSGLARVLQSEENPRTLRAQAMAAFVLCDDPAAGAFFRQALQSLSFELISLAALGSGAIQDTKAIELLASTITAPSASARRAACLALVAIGQPSALEAVARALLQGDDETRRAAAEALANDPKEGHEMLRDGATMADILVRRAVVYGLSRIHEPWAAELLAKIQVEDDQWIVRNAATEVIESRTTAGNPYIPRPLTPPSQTPWLIEFAGKQGVGISPGSPAIDLLLSAVKNGNELEQQAALHYLRRTPSEGAIKTLYQAMQSGDTEMREACFRFLWEAAASGVNLPNPSQYGLD